MIVRYWGYNLGLLLDLDEYLLDIKHRNCLMG